MDEVDEAQKAEALYLAEALNNRTRVGRPGWASLSNCIDCGVVIPAKRRKAVPGCVRCRDCQECEENQWKY